jgi:putative transposase
VKERFSEAQILGFLREAAAGTPVMELCWNHCFSRATFRAWKVRYGEAIAETDRLKQLELENARLRKAIRFARAVPRCRGI